MSSWNMGLGFPEFGRAATTICAHVQVNNFVTSHIAAHKKVSHLCFHWWVHFYIPAFNKVAGIMFLIVLGQY